MNFKKRFFVLVFLTTCYFSSFPQQTPLSLNGKLTVCNNKLCNQKGVPVQLRGLSTHGIQWYGWDRCITSESFSLLQEWGVDILRVALYIQDGGYEANPKGFTNQVSKLIDECSKRGLYVLVDWHQLNPGDPNLNLDKAKTFFTTIASRFKNNNNIIYEICNEPNGVSWPTIKKYANEIVSEIRALDPNAVIVVGTTAWSSFGLAEDRKSREILDDPIDGKNIMYSFHFYAQQHRDNYLGRLKKFAEVLPVFVTEFGLQDASGKGPDDFEMAQKFIDVMNERSISWVYWNYSDHHDSGAVWKPGTCKNGRWRSQSLKPSGIWIKQKLLRRADESATIK